jgi:hypothetical protein
MCLLVQWCYHDAVISGDYPCDVRLRIFFSRNDQNLTPCEAAERRVNDEDEEGIISLVRYLKSYVCLPLAVSSLDRNTHKLGSTEYYNFQETISKKSDD